MKGILIDLFDHSGHGALPYKEAGWYVIQVDIKHGIDILTWDYKAAISKAINEAWEYSTMPKIGLIAAVPCTDYATSGARHFKRKDTDGTTAKSQLLVDKVYDIITFVKGNYSLDFWKVENPRTRIHTLNPWLGKVVQKFDPCDFAGYTGLSNPYSLYEYRSRDISQLDKQEVQNIMDHNMYNKETWLFGHFNKMKLDRIEPVYKENPGWRLMGGKSERTKEARSVDPIGYCRAFYEANH